MSHCRRTELSDEDDKKHMTERTMGPYMREINNKNFSEEAKATCKALVNSAVSCKPSSDAVNTFKRKPCYATIYRKDIMAAEQADEGHVAAEHEE